MKGKSKASSVAVERTQRDLPMKIIAIGVGIALLVTFVFFFVGVVDFNIWHAVVGYTHSGSDSFSVYYRGGKCHSHRGY